MSVFILFEKETDEKAKVIYQNFMPEDPNCGIPEDILSKGIMVDSIPERDPSKSNYTPILYINPITEEFSYEYLENNVTEDISMKIRLQDVTTELVTAKTIIADLQLQNAQIGSQFFALQSELLAKGVL
jgi:hypothetical protein